MRGRFSLAFLALVLTAVVVSAFLLFPQPAGRVSAKSLSSSVTVPEAWTKDGLRDWSLPLAGLQSPPARFSEKEYYAAPADNLRTYPVYYPGREPQGYWESLQHKKPEALVPVGEHWTQEQWAVAGKDAFEGMDLPQSRIWDPRVIAQARSKQGVDGSHIPVNKDGTLAGVRWVVTDKGLALGLTECALCHTHEMKDGTVIDGAPMNRPITNLLVLELVLQAEHLMFPGDKFQEFLFRQYAVPWVPGDVNAKLRTMSDEDVFALYSAQVSGVVARPNGSPFYPTETPDLIGIADQKFLGHTGAQRNRGLADLMRYSALVSCADSMEFGSYHMLTTQERAVSCRHPDDVLYAIASYLSALEPPPNPNRVDAHAARGQIIFQQQHCDSCHTPPAYTNNKLTPALGYQPSQKELSQAYVMRTSVNTDPGLALDTREGTGFYKNPSLRGLWYRGLFFHDGSLANLSDLFDPKRLRSDYVPTGYIGAGIHNRAVPGHEYGMDLDDQQKADLIAFLLTL